MSMEKASDRRFSTVPEVNESYILVAESKRVIKQCHESVESVLLTVADSRKYIDEVRRDLRPTVWPFGEPSAAAEPPPPQEKH